jgi:hypothetical protein
MNIKGLTPLHGVRLTFSKYMKQLVAIRDENPVKEKPEAYKPGVLFSQINIVLEQEADLREMFCLLCKRRNAIAAMVPCGRICCCEVCIKEMVLGLKTCLYCKDNVCLFINILSQRIKSGQNAYKCFKSEIPILTDNKIKNDITICFDY